MAIPTWQGNVSPVLDVARNLLVVDMDAGGEITQHLEALHEASIPMRAEQLRRLSIDVLICGAVSIPLEEALAASGIQVIPHVCGNVEDVLAAYLAGRFPNPSFLMPGCGGCRRRGRGRGQGRRRRFQGRG